METRDVVVFRYSARFGHFLRSESSASALTYPVPPRTALLGLVGAVLGMNKDEPQQLLEEAQFAVSGRRPQSFWHTAKLRKDPPNELPLSIRSGEKGSSKPETATLISQEWLLNPTYTVFARLPGTYGPELADRLRSRRFYYTPYMGLTEMIADLEFVDMGSAEQLPPNSCIYCSTLVRRDRAVLQTKEAVGGATALQVHLMRLPRSVTQDRVFGHADYFYEITGSPIPVTTSDGWRLALHDRSVELMFL